MKHALSVAAVLAFAGSDALAQGADIHTRWGGSGSHFTLPCSTPVFEYEAMISGIAAPYEVKLEVFHNGILKFLDQKSVQGPTTGFLFASPIAMHAWNLREGDSLIFVLSVTDPETGAALGSHVLFGEVGGP